MKSKKTVRSSQFRTGEPLSYGSNLGLPRPQERVPRSQKSSLSPSRKSGLTLVQKLVLANRFSAKPLLSSKLRARRVFESPRTRSKATFSATMRGRIVPGFKLWSRAYNPMHVLRVANPKRVLFCVKRKIRREVLFSLGISGRRGASPGRRRSGKGGGMRRSYSRNGNSLYGC